MDGARSAGKDVYIYLGFAGGFLGCDINCFVALDPDVARDPVEDDLSSITLDGGGYVVHVYDEVDVVCWDCVFERLECSE